MKITLKSKTAREARREISRRWPELDVNFTGYDQNGEDVFMSLVRKQGDKAPVASLRRNRSPRPVKFIANVEE